MADPTPLPPLDPEKVALSTAPPPNQPSVSGRKQAFDDVLKPLTADDLSSNGTQKLVLYMLQEAKSEVELLEGYVERFHESDKRAAILQEKLDSNMRSSKAIEIAVLTGTTLSGAFMGFATYFWSKSPPEGIAGTLSLAVGLALLAGSIGVKTAKG